MRPVATDRAVAQLDRRQRVEAEVPEGRVQGEVTPAPAPRTALTWVATRSVSAAASAGVTRSTADAVDADAVDAGAAVAGAVSVVVAGAVPSRSQCRSRWNG